MKTKLLLYLILLLGLNVNAQIINVSTGVDATGVPITTTSNDPLWTITSSPYPSGTPAKATSSFPGAWEPTPVSATNAQWINTSGDHCDYAGIYTFERDFTVTPGTTHLTCNFGIAFDDVFLSLELVKPDLTVIPITITPTTSYHLSVPITNSFLYPAVGTWKIRTTISISSNGNPFCNIGGYLLSGTVTLDSISIPNCGNTFVKEINPLDSTNPNIFRTSGGDFYTSSTYFPYIILNKFDPNGNAIWTRQLDFGLSDATLTLKDLIIDSSDNQIVGLLNSATGTIIFKYDEATNTFTWINRTGNYRAFNIHESSSTMYTITGSSAASDIEIFEVNQSTGTIGSYQKQGMTGEFYSTFDSGNVYGSCRYYADSGSQFFPSLYKYNATGINLWTKTYVRDTPTARIYPVAPIVDGSSLVELSAGTDDSFDLVNAGTGKIWLLKTDLSGTLNWTKQITVSGYTGFEAVKIINATDGYYLLLNRYATPTQKNLFFVVKTDKNGVVIWANRYGLPTTENYATGGFEKDGFLYLTGMSTTYSAISHMILLKLNSLGKTESTCPFVNPVNASSSVYANVETTRPIVNGTTSFSTTALSGTNSALAYSENVQCNTPCSGIVTQLHPSSCGATLTNINQIINATAVSPTPLHYQFKVTRMAGGLPTLDVQYLIRPSFSFNLTMLASYSYNKTYQVEVAVETSTGWQPYGPPCTVTTPNTLTKIRTSDCGSTVATMGQLFYADIVNWISATPPNPWRFEVTQVSAGTGFGSIQTIDRLNRDLRMNDLTSPTATYATTYSIRVAYLNADGTWSNFGPACLVSTPSFPRTQIQSSQCGFTASSGTQTIWATGIPTSVAVPTHYMFRLTNTASSYSQTQINPLKSFYLNQFPGLMTNTTYDVEVSMEIGGVYGPYGSMCTVTTPNVFKMTPVGHLDSEAKVVANEETLPFKAVVYPNPYEANFNIELETSSDDMVHIRVYDMLGKLIENRSVEPSSIASLQLGSTFTSGVYNIIVTQGENTSTLRVIKI